MRRLVAILLLVCCGTFVPAAVGQLRLCTADLTLTLTAFEAPTQAVAEDACCGDCSTPATEAPCCIHVAKLPNFTAPSPQEALPAIAAWLASPLTFAAAVHLLADQAAAPGARALRAPPGACAERALLEVWRI